jgi:hypothetical protein
MIDMGCPDNFCLPIAIPIIDLRDERMKQLILVFFIALQTIVSSAVLAWSPLDGVESAVEKMQHCYFVVASSEQGQEGEKKEAEQEEEPECD